MTKKKVLLGFSGNAEVTISHVDLSRMDTVQKFLHEPSDFDWGIGGTTVDLAIGFQRLGAVHPMALITVGDKPDDPPRQMITAKLANLGINHISFQVREGTNLAVVLITEQYGARIEGVKYPYVRQPMAEVREHTVTFDPDIVVASGVVPDDAELAIEMFRSARPDAFRVLNPRSELFSAKYHDTTLEILRSASLVIMNDIEFAVLCQEFGFDNPDGYTPEDEDFHDHFGVPELIITRGAKGADYSHNNGTRINRIHQPAVDCGAVCDTTGAGDSFLVGYLTHWTDSGNVEEALRYAATVAGLKVTKKQGAGMPEPDEVHQHFSR